jgi:hypothetical protein
MFWKFLQIIYHWIYVIINLTTLFFPLPVKTASGLDQSLIEYPIQAWRSKLNFEYNPFEIKTLLIKTYFRWRFQTSFFLSKNCVTYFLCRPHTAYTTGSSFNNAIEALIGDHDIAVVEPQTIILWFKMFQYVH